MLKLKMKISIVQEILKSSDLMPCKKDSFVSVIRAGKITKVTKNTKAKLVRNYHARKKLFFIMIRKATSSDLFSFPPS
jgi:hypothetical protein